MSTEEDSALIPLNDVESVPRRRQTAKPVVATTDGYTARDIIAEWSAYLHEKTGFPVPQTMTSRLGKHIKALIHAGYSTNHIKQALTIWTVRWFDNPLLAPEHLERLAWKLGADSTPEARRAQQDLRHAVSTLQGYTTAAPPPATKQEQRKVANTRGKMGWREQYAQRKRQEEGL